MRYNHAFNFSYWDLFMAKNSLFKYALQCIVFFNLVFWVDHVFGESFHMNWIGENKLSVSYIMKQEKSTKTIRTLIDFIVFTDCSFKRRDFLTFYWRYFNTRNYSFLSLIKSFTCILNNCLTLLIIWHLTCYKLNKKVE